MTTYTRNGKAYIVTTDWLLGELHIPMNIITDAVTHAADNGFDANQIETHIRDSMTLFKSTDAEETRVPSPEDISSENTEDGGPLELVINGEMYSFNIDQYGTLIDLVIWLSETLNQVKEQITKDYMAKLAADLPKNITLNIKM